MLLNRKGYCTVDATVSKNREKIIGEASIPDAPSGGVTMQTSAEFIVLARNEGESASCVMRNRGRASQVASAPGECLMRLRPRFSTSWRCVSWVKKHDTRARFLLQELTQPGSLAYGFPSRKSQILV